MEEKEDYIAPSPFKRIRSPSFPKVSISTCLEQLRLFKDSFGCQTEPVEKAFGLFTYRNKVALLDSLYKYSVVDVLEKSDPPVIKLSELGIAIFNRLSPEYDEFRVKVALSPKIHKKIHKHYKESLLIDKSVLRTDFLEVFGFNPKVVDKFLKNFIEVMTWAGLYNKAASTDTQEDKLVVKPIETKSEVAATSYDIPPGEGWETHTAYYAPEKPGEKDPDQAEPKVPAPEKAEGKDPEPADEKVSEDKEFIAIAKAAVDKANESFLKKARVTWELPDGDTIESSLKVANTEAFRSTVKALYYGKTKI